LKNYNFLLKIVLNLFKNNCNHCILMKKVYISICMMINIFLFGQNNLLQNGDFEKIAQCPQMHTKYLRTDTNKIFEIGV